MIAYALALVLALSLFGGLGIGIVPFILLVGIVMVAFRGIVGCVKQMIDASAKFFGITPTDSLRLHLMIGATLLFPPVFPFMLIWAVITFRESRNA